MESERYVVEVQHTVREDGRNGVRPHEHHVWVDAAPLRSPMTRDEAGEFARINRRLHRGSFRIIRVSSRGREVVDG